MSRTQMMERVIEYRKGLDNCQKECQENLGGKGMGRVKEYRKKLDICQKKCQKILDRTVMGGVQEEHHRQQLFTRAMMAKNKSQSEVARRDADALKTMLDGLSNTGNSFLDRTHRGTYKPAISAEDQMLHPPLPPWDGRPEQLIKHSMSDGAAAKLMSEFDESEGGGAKRTRRSSTRKNSTRKRRRGPVRRRTARKKTRQRKPKRTLSKRKKNRGTRRRNR